MSLHYINDATITPKDIEESGFIAAEYDHCSFTHMDLTSACIKGYIFSDCIFEDCNLSLCKLSGSSFRNISFKRCKLLGIRWDECNTFLFSVFFNQCQLDMNVFYGMKMKKTKFFSCSVREVDFTETDLSEAIFYECDLSGAVFDQTNLRSADFRTSRSYIIDPDNNVIKQAKFSWPAAGGLLSKYHLELD
jgi:uncharacterized protein YjbI with pentapeptide repeats